MNRYSLILLIILAASLWRCTSNEITSRASYTIHSDTVLSTSNTEDQYVSRVVLKNISDSAIIEPYIRWQGFPDFRSNEKIVNAIVDTNWNDKRIADTFYHFIRRVIRYKAPDLDKDRAMHNPVKLINSYGDGFCGHFAAGFVNLCNQAGVKARAWDLQGHVVAEVYYDSAWHMYDADYQLRFKDEDGRFVDVRELETNPTIMDDQIIGNFDAEGYKSYFTSTHDNEANHYYQEFAERDHRLEYILHPNEEVVYDVVPNDGWFVRLREFLRDWYIHEHYHDHYPDFFGEGTYIRKLQGEALDTGQLMIDMRWPYRIKSVTANLFLKPGRNAGQFELWGKKDSVWQEAKSWQAKGNRLIIPCRFFDYNWRELNSFTLKITQNSDRVISEIVDSIHIVSQFQFNPRVFLPIGDNRQLAVDLRGGNGVQTMINASWQKKPGWAIEEKAYD